MRIVALIMAGGKGIRFGKDIEKTMIELLGKSLEWPNRGTGIVSLARLWAEQ